MPRAPLVSAVAVTQEGEELTTWGGASTSRAWLVGETVVREAGPWSRSVHSLLRHFEAVGFDGAPKVVGTGFDDAGREVLTFLPGSSPHPAPWTDDAVFAIGQLLRRAHDAADGFVPPDGAEWQPWFGRSLVGDHPVFGHCDAGSWNVVAKDGRPYALIDWEYAGPVDAGWELAHVAWQNAQLFDDDIAERVGLASPAARARQVRLIADGYGIAAGQRAPLIARMLALAVHEARAEAVGGRVTPESTKAVRPDGYPLLWAVTWRARSASWMLTHRHVLEAALI